MKNHEQNRRAGERGNIFFILLVSIALFGALMFTFTRSARQGGDNVSDREMKITASDIVAYAKQMERATSRVMIRGNVSENQLSFVNPVSATDYTNASDCGGDICRIFTSSGGGLEWRDPPPGSGSGWIITGANAVPGIGDDARPDLVLLLPGLSASLCVRINDEIGVANPSGAPPVDSDGIAATAFTGTFTATERIGEDADLSGTQTACVDDAGYYTFYSVLMAR